MTPNTDRATRFRGEGRPKRRLSPSPPPPKQTATKPTPPKKGASKAKDTSTSSKVPVKRKPRTPTPEEESEDEVLPFTFKRGQQLPTTKERQPKTLPMRAYKSVAESGVLSEALEKSRQKWLSDGILEKFWIKYSRKNKDEPAPSSQSMTKINGDCHLVIEPHSFKITLFAVKVPAPSWSSTGSSALAQPTTEQATPKYSARPPTPKLSSPYGFQMHSWTPPPPQSNPSKATDSSAPKQAPAVPSPTIQKPNLDSAKLAETSSTTETTPAESQETAEITKDASLPPARPAQADTSNNTDPVIQMLAARAATNNELKNLMKTVAQGQATQDQLSVFQRHIDELNGIIQAQKRKSLQGTPGSAAMRSTGTPSTPTTPIPNQPFMTAPFPQTQFAHSFQSNGQPKPTVKHEPFSTYHHPPPATNPKTKAPVSAKPVVSAIVFEFNEASGTRYLLPKYSILEYLPGSTQVLMSFLIIRKGGDAVSGKYREQKEYYEPVTVRFVADSSKLLDSLARVVAPPEEVRKYMVETMNKLEPSQDVYLATRLPREVEENGPPRESKITVELEEQVDRFDGPNSLYPLNVGV